jgi:putative DNA primase/helicase
VTTSVNTRSRLIAREGYTHYNQSVAQLYAPHDGFRDAMCRAGLESDVFIIPDGQIHRFKSEGDKRPNGWYVFFGDGGAFGNWRTGLRETWFRDDTQQLDRRKIMAKVKAAQMAQREKLDRKHRQTARIATVRWQAAALVIEHPYLKAKGVSSYGLRIEDINLLIPLCFEQKICSLQTITPKGNKRFLFGGRVSGCYFPIGTPGERIWIAEGYATAATVHELTGDCVVCAFNAGNLVKVAAHIREQFTDSEIYVAADNDEAGINAAMEAMQKYNLEGWVSPDDEKTDWNDCCRTYGAAHTLKGLNDGRDV